MRLKFPLQTRMTFLGKALENFLLCIYQPLFMCNCTKEMYKTLEAGSTGGH